MARVFTLCYFIVAVIVATDAHDYIKTTGGYLQIISEALTWTEAKSRCEAKGSLLYFPENEFELKQVIKELDISSYGYLHVGMSDLEFSGVFMTLDRRPEIQVYNKWDTVSYDKSYHCVQLNVQTRELRKYSCSNKQWFICKIQKPEVMIMNEVKTLLERYAAATQPQNTTTVLEQLSKGMANQAIAEARHSETAQRQAVAAHRQMELLQKQIGNQTMTLLETVAESSAKQSVMLERLTDSIGLLLGAVNNQTTIMAQVLAKMQDEDNSNMQLEQK